MLNLGLWCSVFSKHCIVQRDRWYYDSYNSSMTLNPCSQLIQQNLCWNKVCNKILIFLELLKVDFLILTCLVPPRLWSTVINNKPEGPWLFPQAKLEKTQLLHSFEPSLAPFPFLILFFPSVFATLSPSPSTCHELRWKRAGQIYITQFRTSFQFITSYHKLSGRWISIIVPIAALKNPSQCTTDMSYETYTIIMHLALSRQTGPFWSLFLSSSSSCFFLSFLEKKSWRRTWYQKRRKSCIQGE